ncbi:hypothetical protein ACFXAF_28175 [Kitasatospora sp. NPDC059463]|uniref:hypothetical protein n=1 Tax=unclassified Kitasatospora TaxID=2633591 RepID=UPI003677C65B
MPRRKRPTPPTAPTPVPGPGPDHPHLPTELAKAATAGTARALAAWLLERLTTLLD